jgi:hypothetical protein
MKATKLRPGFTAAFMCLMIGAVPPTLCGAEDAPQKAAAATVAAEMTAKPPATPDSLAASMQILRHDVDALEKKADKPDKPWYFDVSTMIAVLSFVFAFGTTWFSSRKAKAQEIEADRNELRTLLQRMAALPKENFEAQVEFGANPGALSTISGYINQENTVLTGQAAEIALRLPKGKVSAVEYYAIALGLGNAYEIGRQKQFLQLAIDHATDFNTEIAAIRTTAFVLFLTGTPDSGRVEYQKALAIFDRYPGYDEYTRNGTHIKTEIAWAYSEYQAHPGNPLALPHLDRANELLQTLVPSPGRKQFEADIAQARQQLTFPAVAPAVFSSSTSNPPFFPGTKNPG